MSIVTCHLSISIDGFAAGPNQSVDNPLGEGGMRLHDWIFDTRAWHEMQGEEGGASTPDSDAFKETSANVGAYIMGRKMFGGGAGAWDESWTGWWGDEPPYRTQVFVLTHHQRRPLRMGATTFNFVTDGIESALDQARDAAGDKDVLVAGGASTARQYMVAGKLDELNVHISPIILGAGESLWKDVGHPVLKPVKVAGSDKVTHIRYRFVQGAI
jgi:dihydrofolate reductase